jgi:hypothetical protein
MYCDGKLVNNLLTYKNTYYIYNVQHINCDRVITTTQIVGPIFFLSTIV